MTTPIQSSTVSSGIDLLLPLQADPTAWDRGALGPLRGRHAKRKSEEELSQHPLAKRSRQYYDGLTEDEWALRRMKAADRQAVNKGLKELRVSPAWANAGEVERKKLEEQIRYHEIQIRIVKGLHASLKAQDAGVPLMERPRKKAHDHNGGAQCELIDRLAKQEKVIKELQTEVKELQKDNCVPRKALGADIRSKKRRAKLPTQLIDLTDSLEDDEFLVPESESHEAPLPF
ncbi:MAG: hypothetical protein Q9166_001022 [cf. Caloplaca sp. 2 TL-2023]